MSCNVEVGIIVFRAQLEMVFHHRPQRNACLRIIATLDRNHGWWVYDNDNDNDEVPLLQNEKIGMKEETDFGEGRRKYLAWVRRESEIAQLWDNYL
jgi:hypothetical protein